MALTASDVYHLTVVELRQECSDRGLDSSGPVRTLRRRLAELVRINIMEASVEEWMAQASVQIGSVSKVEQPVPYNVDCGSHGGGVDSQAGVLGNCYVRFLHCRRKSLRIFCGSLSSWRECTN
jgi:hypothetical protein